MGVRRFVQIIFVFCSVAILIGMGCSCGIGCFVQRLVRPRDVNLIQYGVLFGIDVLFGYDVLFIVLFAQKVFSFFDKFGLNSVHVR